MPVSSVFIPSSCLLNSTDNEANYLSPRDTPLLADANIPPPPLTLDLGLSYHLPAGCKSQVSHPTALFSDSDCQKGIRHIANAVLGLRGRAQLHRQRKFLIVPVNQRKANLVSVSPGKDADVGCPYSGARNKASNSRWWNSPMAQYHEKKNAFESEMGGNSRGSVVTTSTPLD